MTDQCIFPAELVLKILGYTSPLDVVRWRTVSKGFRAVTHDPELWKALHENASFVRPPGLFPTGSSEHALVRSARLAQSWTTRGFRITSQTEMRFQGCVKGCPALIRGRWFIACQQSKRFVLYDTDSNQRARLPQLLWEQGEPITHWEYGLATSDQQLVVHVLLSTRPMDSQWLLLEFRLNADCGALCGTVTLDVPSLGSNPTPELYSGQEACERSPFVFISNPNPTLVFDMRTRVFYKFPEFHLALHDIGSVTSLGEKEHWIMPINTHIIVFRRNPELVEAHMVVQAFSFPNDLYPVKDKTGTLRLTHEGILKCRRRPFGVVRNPVVDPLTGSVNMRLLASCCDCCEFQFTCIDLTLPPPTMMDVSPITVKQSCVFTTSDVTSDLHFGPSCCRRQYVVTNNGYVRGIVFAGCCDQNNIKFAIDATQDRCVADVGYAPKHPPQSPTDWADEVTWDGVRGRFIYATEETTASIIDFE